MLRIYYKDAERIICRNDPNTRNIRINYAFGLYYSPVISEMQRNICKWLTVHNTTIKHLALYGGSRLYEVSAVLQMFMHHVSIGWLSLYGPTVHRGEIEVFRQIATTNDRRIEKILLVNPTISIANVELLVNMFRDSTVEFRITPDLVGVATPHDTTASCTAMVPDSVWLFRGKSWGILKHYRELNRPPIQEDNTLSDEEADERKWANSQKILGTLPAELWLMILSFLEDTWDIQSVQQTCNLFHMYTHSENNCKQNFKTSFGKIRGFTRNMIQMFQIRNWENVKKWIKICPGYILNANMNMDASRVSTPLQISSGTFIHHAIVMRAPPFIIDLLLERGVDEHIQDSYGQDALQYAIRFKHDYARRAILSRNSNDILNTVNWDGETTREIAERKNVVV